MEWNFSLKKIWDLQKYDGNTAVIEDTGQMLNYGELNSEGSSLALAAGNRCLIFLLCSNSVGSILGYVAFLNNGIVPVMLNRHLEREFFDNLMEIYHPSYLWLPIEQKNEFDGMELVYEAYGYILLKTAYDHKYTLHNDLALLLSTSGSTGSPKFVRQSYENIIANMQSIAEYLELDSAEKPITTLPMNYTYGLSILNTHLFVGAAILLTDKSIMQAEFWEFFKRHGATSFGGVPYTYEMLDKLRFFSMDLPSLQTMTQAGGKLVSSLHEKFAKYAEETGRNFVVMYGQCEATARMGYLPPDRAVEKKGSMGIAIPGGRFKLIGPDGMQVTEPHVTGELVYEGANVTMGYAECGEDLSKGNERGGVLVTGDMAEFDEDGFYYIAGRKKRFLKIYGNRVNLDETEQLIKSRYGVDAACAGIDDHMYIFLTDDKDAENVRKYVSARTGLNPAAFKTAVIAEIPKNDSGKTQYAELSKYFENT